MNQTSKVLSLELDTETHKIIACSTQDGVGMSFKDFFEKFLSEKVFGYFYEEYNYSIIEKMLATAQEESVYFHIRSTPMCVHYLVSQIKENVVLCLVERSLIADKSIASGKIDFLSGLYSRTNLMAQIKTCMQDKSVYNFYFIIIDVNNFKLINDTFGHRVGDDALRKFSQMLLNIRDDNILGRYGGDEFIMFCPNKSREEIVELANKILSCKFELNINGISLKVSCCCGMTFSYDKACTFDYFLEKADKSLYLSKGKGKNVAYLDGECILKVSEKKCLRKEQLKSFKLFNVEKKERKFKMYSFLTLLIVSSIFIVWFTSFFLRSRLVIVWFVLSFIATFVLILANYLKSNLILSLKNTDSTTKGLNYFRFKTDAKILMRNKKYAIVNIHCCNFLLLFHSEEEKRIAILKDVHDVILSYLKGDELVARVYFDRFIFIVENNLETDERIRKILEIVNNQIYESYKVQIGAVAGVYLNEIYTDHDIEYSLDMARLALRYAKSEINDLVTYYDEKMLLDAIKLQTIEKRARQALINNEFVVYYQPKRDIINNKWHSSEALVRWEDPVEGLIFPDKFIDLFESNGLIVELDLYVFEKVCNNLNEDYLRKEKLLPVSVNISRKLLEVPNFMQGYKSIIDRYSFPHSLIIFELTETIMVENEQVIKKMLEEIHGMGCSCSVDDFGVGYSSLSLISKYDFDEIKLDRSFFIGKASLDDKTKTLVKSIVQFSIKFNFKIVAEGVENVGLLDYLKSIGCNYAQGYVFSKPVPFDEYKKLIKKDN